MKQLGMGFLLATVATLTCCACAQEPGAKPPAAGSTAPEVLRFKHLRIDRDKRQVMLDAKVCMEEEGPLELLICRTGTKEYESVLATEALGAHLHAALLSLDLTPGLAAMWSGSGDEAKFLPPRGPELKITMRWKDKDGNMQEADAGDWLKHTGKKAGPVKKWVFIGSKILPDNRYWADVNGEIVSVSNFESAVIDVPFESPDDWNALEYQADIRAIPPKDTPVEVIITPLGGADRSPYARAMLEIDRFGQMQINGRAATSEQIAEWAEKFVSRHPRAYVVIRSDGRALVDDVQNAIAALRRGGIRDYDVERLRPRGVVLPRTPAQVKEALKNWAEKFSQPGSYLIDPAEEAAETLEQIQREMHQSEAARKMLTEYADALRSHLEKNKAGTTDRAKP